MELCAIFCLLFNNAESMLSIYFMLGSCSFRTVYIAESLFDDMGFLRFYFANILVFILIDNPRLLTDIGL